MTAEALRDAHGAMGAKSERGMAAKRRKRRKKGGVVFRYLLCLLRLFAAKCLSPSITTQDLLRARVWGIGKRRRMTGAESYRIKLNQTVLDGISVFAGSDGR